MINIILNLIMIIIIFIIMLIKLNVLTTRLRIILIINNMLIKQMNRFIIMGEHILISLIINRIRSEIERGKFII